jgi:hypothetical protein
VAAAYGWPEDIPDDDALARLFELNQDRAASVLHDEHAASAAREEVQSTTGQEEGEAACFS